MRPIEKIDPKHIFLGYQCQICTQVIHKKCLSSVVTICAVSASSDGNGNHSCGDLPDGASPIEAIGMRLEVPHSWKPKTYKVYHLHNLR